MAKSDIFYQSSNLQALNESLSQLKNGDTVVKTMEELEKMAADKNIDANTLALIENEMMLNDPTSLCFKSVDELFEELDSE